MKNGICPKCDSNEVIGNLMVHGGQAHPPDVDIVEPEPAHRPFLWMTKNAQSQFRAYACGVCGYTEFYAENHENLNEGRRKGYSIG